MIEDNDPFESLTLEEALSYFIKLRNERWREEYEEELRTENGRYRHFQEDHWSWSIPANLIDPIDK